MKKLLITMLAIMPLTSLADNNMKPVNDEQAIFTAWCDAFTAQGLASLTANRIFGNISSLDDQQYQARTKWVNDTYAMAAKRFTQRTGHQFDEIDAQAMSKNWAQQCQLKDQIQ